MTKVLCMDLRPYQRDALAFMAGASRHVNALPPGVGKTAISARWLRSLPPPRGSQRALVVAPLSVLPHWQHELEEWAPEWWAVIGTGSPAGRAKNRGIVRDYDAMPTALVVNYEAMRSDVADLIKCKFDTIIFDEAHRLKNRSSQTFRAAAKLARRCENLSLVTGTPVLNRADELWALLHCLDAKGYPSFWRWAAEHFYIDTEWFGMRPTRIVGDMLPGHDELIRAELADVLYFRPLDDLLPDLPSVIETTIEVVLSGAERKAYESLSTKNWAEIGDELVITPNAVARNTRLRQLSSDWSAFDPDVRAGAKIKAAADLIQDLEGQVVVFCAFQATCDALWDMVDGSTLYHGGLPAGRRERALQDFRSGDERVLIGTAASMGEGVDGLQVAKHVVFIDRDWTPARNEQALSRVAGGRTLHEINVWQVVAQDSTDQVVAEALARKEDVIQAIIKYHEKD